MLLLAIVASRLGDLTAGLFIGLLVGILIGPRLWSWIAWRERHEASLAARREDRLLDEVLARMIEDHRSSSRSATGNGHGED